MSQFKNEQAFQAWVKRCIDEDVKEKEVPDNGFWFKKLDNGKYACGYMLGDYEVEVSKSGNLIYTITNNPFLDT